MTAARCLFCGRGFVGTAEQVHALFTSHDCDAPFAATASFSASQAARFPTTHGKCVSVEPGVIVPTGAPTGNGGCATAPSGPSPVGTPSVQWFAERLAGVYALERRFPREAL